MEVTITHSGIASSVQVSSSIPNVVSVAPTVPINIELQLFRDGVNGKSAYELALELNPNIGTQAEWLASIQFNWASTNW